MNFVDDGYTVVPDVLACSECERIATAIAAALQTQGEDAIGTRRGGLVGGRNLLALWSGWRVVTDHPAIADMIRRHAGETAGIVRILFFDKPPGHGWSLSLHRDKTIAVAQHHDPPSPFAKPTRKAGVPHVEATDELLSRMLTLRLHLDPMQDENGALFVVPGSHRLTSACNDQVSIHCGAGAVFAMRPLLLHGSHAAAVDTKLHRRVVHLEIAPGPRLPAPYRWHQFTTIWDRA